MDLFKDVQEFHKKFGLNHAGNTSPNLLDNSTEDFRTDFMQEELDEYVLACQDGNMEKAADALCDLVYVALGTAHLMGLPFNELWAEVQKANMAKERATGSDDKRSTRMHALDVVKPAGWTPPDLNKILIEHGWVP